MKTPRQLVYDTLDGKNTGRAPRQLWTLPWAEIHYGPQLRAIQKDYPDDIVGIGVPLREMSPCSRGNSTDIGKFTDDWGCTFENLERGIIGEVKDPLVKEDDWSDAENVHIPYEWLTFDIEEANGIIHRYAEDKFRAAGFWARPFEQLQFIRGTENLYMDLAAIPAGLTKFLSRMHTFYCDLMEKWCKTDVDTVCLMDDWGAQRGLLIHPEQWRKLFKPLYKDYIDIAKRHGKRSFMHSDGYTLDILPDLVEIGLDAINTQIFCMGMDKLMPFRGKITFWGEIDRQHLLPYASTEEIRFAVDEVYAALYDRGYCIAQCEFGPGAKPENVREVFVRWNELTANVSMKENY